MVGLDFTIQRILKKASVYTLTFIPRPAPTYLTVSYGHK